MASLWNATCSFFNYVSPRKTQQRRDKPFKVPALPVQPSPLKKHLATSLMREDSPITRVSTWETRTPSPQSDVDVTLIPPSPPTSAQALLREFEGDTLVPDSPYAQDDDKSGSSADEWNANEDTIVVDDGSYLDRAKIFDVGQERRRREKQGRELRSEGWSEDAIFLFQKLGMRGFEPLLPIDWINDFETLPEDLFTANPDKAFIKPCYDSDWRAQKALTNLFDIGGLARDARLTKTVCRTPAFHVKRGVNTYRKWAMRDVEVAHLWSSLPLFEIITWPRHVDASVGEKRTVSRLRGLYERWRTALSQHAEKTGMRSVVPEVPTLYALTASHTVMAFVSYDPPAEEGLKPAVRLVAMFDFGKEGYDVWNSLAIAIFVIHCRNRMIQLKDYIPEPEIIIEEDPDV